MLNITVGNSVTVGNMYFSFEFTACKDRLLLMSSAKAGSLLIDVLYYKALKTVKMKQDIDIILLVLKIEDKIEDLYQIEDDDFRKLVINDILISLNELKAAIGKGDEGQQKEKWTLALRLLKLIYPDFILENKIQSIIEIFTQI